MDTLWIAKRAGDMLFRRGINTVHIVCGQVVHIQEEQMSRRADEQKRS